MAGISAVHLLYVELINIVYKIIRPQDKNAHFSYFSTKTYVLGTQKNRLREMAPFSIQNTFCRLIRKISHLYVHETVLSGSK